MFKMNSQVEFDMVKKRKLRKRPILSQHGCQACLQCEITLNHFDELFRCEVMHIFTQIIKNLKEEMLIVKFK